MHEMYDKMMKRRSYLWKMQDQDQRMIGEKILSEWEVFGKVRVQKGSREIEKSEREIAPILYIETS